MARLCYSHMRSILLFLLCLLSGGALSDPLSILVSIPANEQEYTKIFGSPPKGDQLKIIQKIRSESPKKSLIVNSKQDILNDIASSDHFIILIIGHNEDGVFHLPSGETLKISDLSDEAKKLDKYLVFLSCRSQKHTEFAGTRTYISYNDAFALAKNIESELMGDDSDTEHRSVPSQAAGPFDSPPPFSSSPSFTPSASTTSLKQCKDVFLNVSTREFGRVQLDRSMRSIIRKYEIKKITSPITISALTAGIAVTLSADESDR